MLSTFHRTLAVMVCALTVTACASDSITVRSSLNARNVAVHFSEAAKDGSMHTDIVGNPLTVSDEAWHDRITTILSTAHFGPDFALDADTAVDRVTKARIVMQFQPPESTTLLTICDDVDTLESSVEGDGYRLEAIAAFCVENRVMDWAIISGPMPASLGDEKLTDFASAIAMNIIRPNVRDDKGCNNDNCS
jgi:hypothetical protein